MFTHLLDGSRHENLVYHMKRSVKLVICKTMFWFVSSTSGNTDNSPAFCQLHTVHRVQVGQDSVVIRITFMLLNASKYLCQYTVICDLCKVSSKQ